MSVKVTITADLVVCQVEVIAEVGQRLLVVNGVCLGVYSGEELVTQPRPIERKRRVFRPSTRVITQEDVMNAVGDRRLTTQEVGDALRLARSDSATRNQVGRLVHVLEAAGMLRTPADDTRPRYHSWEVVPSAERGLRVVGAKD